MANYKDIKGFHVQSLSSDPVANQAAGGSWASGTALNTARDYVGGTVTPGSDSALIFGGSSTAVEQYNGSSWTEKTEMNAPAPISYSRYPAGTATAALASGGGSTYSVTVEQWNGSGWTEIADLNEGRGFASASPIGTVTAALVAGGYEANPGVVTKSNESWNGASWTEVADLNVARGYNAGLGTSTSALMTNGQAAPPGMTVLNDVESWNGASWTAVSACNSGRVRGVAAGESNSGGLFFGGATAPNTSVAKTEFWDGTSWTEVADLAAGRMRGGGGGTLGIALIAGGDPGPAPTTSATEEWANGPSSFSQMNVGQTYFNSSPTNAFKVTQIKMSAGAWSSGGNLPQNMILQGAFGTRDAVTTGGGSSATAVIADSFQYNGASWSEIAELNTLRNQSAGLGTQNSGLVAGGYNDPPGAVVGNVENWNGSSWTEVADVSPVRTGAGSAGVYTAGLVFGGNQPPLTTSTMTWNGASWTEVNELNAARNRFMGQAIGSQTAALAVEGEGVAGTESWNGTSWTEVNDLNTSRHLGGGSGIQTSAVVSSGRTGAPGYNPSVLVESYDGISWTEQADVSSGRAYLSSAGTGAGSPNTTSIIFGGATTSSTANTAATEEWNVPTANYTITVS